MKQCKVCKVIKNDSDFYNGRGSCKTCFNLRAQAWQVNNKDKVRGYKNKYQNDHPEKQKEYRATHKDRQKELHKNWRASNPQKVSSAQLKGISRHPEKYKARWAVNNAIQDGRLTKSPCEVCGNPKSQAHHDDYSKPLDVRWLCQKHHTEHHSIVKQK